MTRPARLRLSLLVVPLLAALAGCGGAADPERAGPSSGADEASSTGASSAEGGRGSAGADAGNLADEAEKIAGESSAVPARSEPVLGADISWPQCPPGMGIPERRTKGMPMPVAEAEYVVIGLTNGPGFTPNPCLAEQVAWARERKLLAAGYSVLSYPTAAQLAEHGGTGPYDGSTRAGALRNVGYQQASYNVENLRAAGLRTPLVWLDVEPVPDWEWSSDLAANAAVVEGAARGYRKAGYEVGVYSTPYMWAEIVGEFAMGVPEWRAAGLTSRAEALNRCVPDWSIQGGRAVLGQWVESDRDHNVTCPGIAADLGRWFHQY